ncbi:phage Gp37/Gp68 family protein [Streptomyces sp. NPDC000927]|uniref:DUF5131 family protein n=1 Tax=Streptomyces sp. NPDC000927 TaxID=3154371 RepID=UPI0033200F6F
MAKRTTIEWTQGDDGAAGQTWNPTTGCDRTTPGCDRCYALTMAKRLKSMGVAKYQSDGNPKTSGPGFGVAMHEDTLTEPFRWKKPRRVFVNSMSDLFHADVTDEFIAKVFAVMAATPQHTYQILTKRHGRMRSLIGGEIDGGQRLLEAADEETARILYDAPSWPLSNVWLGVSIEDQKRADLRIPALLETAAAVRFLSCEPLLGPVRLVSEDHSGHERDWDGDSVCLDCSTSEERVPWRTADQIPPGIDWVICGGESGPGARPLEIQWITDLIDDARTIAAAPFVKQLGSVWARENKASDSKGGKPEDWPDNLRVREYPKTAPVESV